VKIINFFIIFFIIIFGYNVIRCFELIRFFQLGYYFSLLLLSSIILFLCSKFYEKNLNFIFTYKNNKLIVHKFLNIYVFDINNTYIKTGGYGINSYFYIYESSTYKKVKFNCLFWGIKRFEILKKQLDELLITENLTVEKLIEN
jgi:hypothetical protein